MNEDDIGLGLSISVFVLSLLMLGLTAFGLLVGSILAIVALIVVGKSNA
jgi:hypothetical protein